MGIRRYNENLFWSNPVYLPYLQKRLTQIGVKKCEEKIGYTLPDELINLLQIQNGGYVNSLGYGGLDLLFGIGDNSPNILEATLQMRSDYKMFNTEKLVAIDGDGHYYICLDYRKKTNDPCISWFDFECNTETYLAKSFKDYLNEDELSEEEMEDAESNTIYAVSASMDELVELIKTKNGLEIQGQESTHNGYAVLTVLFGKDSICQLSPNAVRKGFIRKDHPKFLEMKDMLPQSVKRFAEAALVDTIVVGLGYKDKFGLIDRFRDQGYRVTEIFNV